MSFTQDTQHLGAVNLAHHCLLFLVDADDPRELAEAALAASPKLRAGMSDEVRKAVLDRFEPTREPVAGKDYLPEPGADAAALVSALLEA